MNYLEELERLRKKVWIKTIISFLLGTILGAYIIFSSISSINSVISVIVFIIIYVAVPGILLTKLFTRKNVKEYKKIYKKNITRETLKSFFTDVNYSPGSGLPISVISSTKMMKTGNRYHSNDLISGKYKGVKFKCADVHIEEKYVDKDGEEHYTTLFKGQWFVFDFNKKFKANIQICEKSFSGAKRGNWFSDEVYKKVKMEDVEFNKMFKVYAENELDAFYVLTPNTMNKIKKLNNELRGNLLFCLINSKMHIGLHNGNDLFEPNVYRKINIEEDKQRILNDIKKITKFVDVLDLDNDLFKRRD